MNEKLKLAAILVGAGFCYGVYELYDFYSNEQVKMQAEAVNEKQVLSSKKEELAKLKSFSEGIAETKTRIKKINTEFEEALEFIPRSLDMSQLMARLSSLGRNSGIEVLSFKPIKEEKNSSEPPKPEAGANPAAVAGDAKGNGENITNPFYQAVKLELQLRGGFAQTVTFFDQISRLKRILKLETLKMQPKSVEGERVPSSLSTVLDSTLVFKTYKFNE